VDPNYDNKDCLDAFEAIPKGAKIASYKIDKYSEVVEKK
jgi:hypothetical protein